MDHQFELSRKTNVILFVLSIFTLLYWTAGKIVNVYQFAFLGAVFETLWLPMLAMLLFIPIASLVALIKNKAFPKYLPVYSILLIAITIFLVFIL